MNKRPENRADAIRLLESRKHSIEIEAGKTGMGFAPAAGSLAPSDAAMAAGIPYPSVVESTHRGERTWDIFSRLLKDRIVFLGSGVDDTVANIIIAQFLFLGLFKRV